MNPPTAASLATKVTIKFGLFIKTNNNMNRLLVFLQHKEKTTTATENIPKARVMGAKEFCCFT